MSAQLFRVALLSLLLPLCGCHSYDLFSYPTQARGEQMDPSDLKQLVPGISTRRDVTALLGSPTQAASFDPNAWIYISQVTHPVIAGTLGVNSQHVYVLTFDTGGVLQNVASKDKADALPVQVVTRTTPSPGTNASFMQQLIGNIGRFNPSAVAPALTPSGTNTPGNF